MVHVGKIRKSLVYKITVSLTIIIVILLTVLVLSNVYSLRVVKNNVVNACQNQLSIYMNDIRSSFTEVTRDLNEISVKFIENVVNYGKENELNRYFRAVELKDVLTAKIITGNAKDGLFVLKPKDGLVLFQFSSRIPAKERTRLTDLLNSENAITRLNTKGSWCFIEADGCNYIVKSFTVYDFLIGAIIKPDTLLADIAEDPFYGTVYIITNKNDEIVSKSFSESESLDNILILNKKLDEDALKNKYLVISADIPEIEGRMSCIIESKNAFLGLNLIQWIIVLLGIVSVIAVPFVVFYLFENIVKPVQRLITATREVERGNWDYKITEKKIPAEFAQLNDAFFSMVREIKELKIASYEEKIERQKAELRYLQIQIRPHFFLNVLTTISNLTYQGKSEEIRKLIQYLSKHLRYIFRGGLVLVTLKEEIECVKNYIRLHEMKFPNNIFYVIELAPGTEKCRMPQLIIQTFVENCFKHALSVDSMLSILIKTDIINRNNASYVKIVIEDNGDGFPEEIIECINGSADMKLKDGEKIGIANIKKTLSLLYRENNLLKISNCEPSGARVEIFIPIRGESNALPSCG